MPEHPFWLLPIQLEEDMTEQNLWNKISHWLHPSCPDLISSLFLWMSVMRYSNQQYYWNSLIFKQKKVSIVWRMAFMGILSQFHFRTCLLFFGQKNILQHVFKKLFWYVGDRLCHCQENSGFTQQEWGVSGPCLLCGGCHQISHVCQAIQT